MLVLTRKTNEAVIIDTPLGPVRVTVVDAGPGRTKLGVAANRAIPIRREEAPAPTGGGRPDGFGEGVAP